MMYSPPIPALEDWNGREIAVARTRGGIIVTADPSDNLLRGGVTPWPPPEVVQKGYQSRQARAFDEPELNAATRAWGFYCDLQSIHSEDAVTWSVFGPLVYSMPEVRGRYARALLMLLDVPLPSGGPAHIWLWRRIPHPDNLVPGGPEIDVGIHMGSVVVFGEAKWRSPVGTSQGVAGDKDQIGLRREFCERYGRKLYPEAERFVVLGIGRERGIIPRADLRCGDAELHLRDVAWAQVAWLAEHPCSAELQLYLAWKAKHTQSR